MPKTKALDHVIVPGGYAPSGVPHPLSPEEQAVVDDFHRRYYAAWQKGRETIDLSFMGRHTLKCPLDLWVYQEIIVETAPEIIVECGTNKGGSALFLAAMCQLLGRGRVLTMDIEEFPDRPEHPLIEYVMGSSTDPALVRAVGNICRNRRTMVILDSDHSRDHVFNELQAYSPMVSPGCYLIVEDSNVGGHPAWPEFGPGPMEALDLFMDANPPFELDMARQRFWMTLNPRGYLRRI